MRRDHGRRGRVHNVPERRIRNVRNVDHHPQTIHLAHDVFPKLVKPARRAHVVARRSGPTRTHAPRRRHVTHTEIVVAFYVLETFINRISTFESEQRRDLPFTRRTPNVSSRSREHPRLRMLLGEPVPDSVIMAYGGKALKMGPDYFIPKPFDPRVLWWVAPAVAKAAMESGVARITFDIAEYRERLISKGSNAAYS